MISYSFPPLLLQGLFFCLPSHWRQAVKRRPAAVPPPRGKMQA
nr:MAG TPA: hypothetical protein [Caudoviricetes sp.]DAU95956.1 MAG TPA: hypothetical protein [Caudoviricetes sp.]